MIRYYKVRYVVFGGGVSHPLPSLDDIFDATSRRLLVAKEGLSLKCDCHSVSIFQYC